MKFFYQQSDRAVNSSGIDDFIMIEVLKWNLNERRLFT